MKQVMKLGVRYYVDHPLFDRYRFHDGVLEPGRAGWISKSNGSPISVEGKLRYSGTEGLPREWSGEIQVIGMKVILPDGTEAPIYEQGAERPSTKADREKKAAEHKAKFIQTVDSIVAEIMDKLGGAAVDSASERLRTMLIYLKEHRQTDLLLLNGYVIGLEAGSFLSSEEGVVFRKKFTDLARDGELLSAFERPFRH